MNRVSTKTGCSWKSKYGGLEVSEALRLEELEEDNRRLKHMVADLRACPYHHVTRNSGLMCYAWPWYNPSRYSIGFSRYDS